MTRSIVGSGYVAVSYPVGTAAQGVVDNTGTLILSDGDTANDRPSDGCFDDDGNVYFAYVATGVVRVSKWDISGVSEAWDVSVTTMTQVDGNAKIVWFEDILYVWTFDSVSEGNQPAIFRLEPATGAIVAADAGSAWTTTARGPGLDSGIIDDSYPGIRVTATRVWMLAQSAGGESVYLLVINKDTLGPVLNSQLNTLVDFDDAAACRGIEVDQVEEEAFVAWIEFDDSEAEFFGFVRGVRANGTSIWTQAPSTEVNGLGYREVERDLYITGIAPVFGNPTRNWVRMSAVTGTAITGGALISTSTTFDIVQIDPTNVGPVVAGRVGIEERLNAFAATPGASLWSYLLIDAAPYLRSDYLSVLDVVSTLPFTTTAPTSLAPTTPAPTTLTPFTLPPELLDKVQAGYTFRRSLQEAFGRATLVDETDEIQGDELDPKQCTMELFGESGTLGSVVGEEDPAGAGFVRFRLSGVSPQPSHAYMLRIRLVRVGGETAGLRDFPMATT